MTPDYLAGWIDGGAVCFVLGAVLIAVPVGLALRRAQKRDSEYQRERRAWRSL